MSVEERGAFARLRNWWREQCSPPAAQWSSPGLIRPSSICPYCPGYLLSQVAESKGQWRFSHSAAVLYHDRNGQHWEQAGSTTWRYWRCSRGHEWVEIECDDIDGDIPTMVVKEGVVWL